MSRARFKIRDKHVDACSQKLSDGGSIPPASTNYLILLELPWFEWSWLVVCGAVSNSVSNKVSHDHFNSKHKPQIYLPKKLLYYFRYTLPPDISKLVGKTGLRYSLRTGYIKQAERKASRLAGTVEDFISEIRQESYRIMNLSTEQLQALLDQYLRKALDDDEDKRLSANRMNSTEGLPLMKYYRKPKSMLWSSQRRFPLPLGVDLLNMVSVVLIKVLNIAFLINRI